MKKRLDALTRFGRMQAKLHDLGRSRLSAMEREEASLADDLQAVFEALESSDAADGALAKFASRHIRSLQKRLDSLGRESDQVRRKVMAHGIRAMLADQAAEAAGKAWREQKERKELAEVIERAVARGDTRPR